MKRLHRTAISILALTLICGCSKGTGSNSTTTTKTVTTTNGAPASTAPAKAVVNGSVVFGANCATCHGSTGAGQPGAFPPLAGNPMVTGDPAKVIAVINNGLSGSISIKGQTYNGQMPAWKSILSADQRAAVITYIRSSWGNKASAVTPAQVGTAK